MADDPPLDLDDLISGDDETAEGTSPLVAPAVRSLREAFNAGWATTAASRDLANMVTRPTEAFAKISKPLMADSTRSIEQIRKIAAPQLPELTDVYRVPAPYTPETRLAAIEARLEQLIGHSSDSADASAVELEFAESEAISQHLNHGQLIESLQSAIDSLQEDNRVLTRRWRIALAVSALSPVATILGVLATN